jgi:hypothetical protein
MAQPKADINYIDLVTKNNQIFALSDRGRINTFDVNTGARINRHLYTDTAITSISIDKNGNIILIRKKDFLLFDEKTSKHRIIGSIKEKIYGIVFDAENKVYVISKKGITDLATGKTYIPDTAFRLNHYVRGWWRPSAIFMDDNDRIWAGFGFGEWGGELFIFNTKTKQFIKPTLNKFRIELSPVKSIFSDGKSVFISCGLEHMYTSGAIVKFDDFKCSAVFLSDTKMNITDKGEDKSQYGEYIGPAFYDQKSNSLYFYSQNGIFKGDLNQDLSKITDWKKIAAPRLHWTDGQPDAVGSPMNVLKMIMTQNGNIFLLTQNDGIGMYNGKDFTLLH